MAPKTILTMEQQEKLILLVKERPQLYDKTHSEYKNHVIRENKWAEIAEAMEFDIAKCQKSWTSLRNQYTKFLPKKKLPSGSGTQKPPYFGHENAMAFLKDVVDPCEKTISNLLGVEVTTQSVVEDEMTTTIEGSGLEVSEIPTNTQALRPLNSSNLMSSKSSKRKLDAFDKEMLGLLKCEDDEFDMFTKMLAPKLRKISEISRRSFLRLQKTINDAVADVELELVDS